MRELLVRRLQSRCLLFRKLAHPCQASLRNAQLLTDIPQFPVKCGVLVSLSLDEIGADLSLVGQFFLRLRNGRACSVDLKQGPLFGGREAILGAFQRVTQFLEFDRERLPRLDEPGFECLQPLLCRHKLRAQRRGFRTFGCQAALKREVALGSNVQRLMQMFEFFCCRLPIAFGPLARGIGLCNLTVRLMAESADDE